MKATTQSLEVQNAELKKKLEELKVVSQKVDLLIRDNNEIRENQKEILTIQREIKAGLDVIQKRTTKRLGVTEVSKFIRFLSVSNPLNFGT